MSVRATMADLIAEVRLLINDPNPGAPTVPVFTDQQIQDALDRHREDDRYMELAAAPTIASGGAVSWLDYYAMSGEASILEWEQDAQILSNTFAPLTPATSDWIVGHWTFATDTRPPVYMVGKTYDRYWAAAELLQKWAATKVLNLDFSTDRQSFKFSNQRTALLDLAHHYLQQARPSKAQMVRQDVPQELWTRRNFDVSRTSF